MSAHPANRRIASQEDINRLRAAREPLFGIGQVYATPAAMLHLVQHVYPHDTLVSRHRRGDYGDLCAEDIKANDDALIHGGRILSSYTCVGGRKIYVITEAEDDAGARAMTTILFAEEY